LVHRPSLTDRGSVIGFYAVAKLMGGGYSFEFMSTDEVNHIRDKAAEKNRAKKDKNGRPVISGPWADNYVEMGRKTALRRLFKYLPISIESLAFATAIDGNAVSSAAPLEEIAFEVSRHDEATVDQETGEITPPPAQIEHQQPAMTIPHKTPPPEMEPVRAELRTDPEQEAAFRAAEIAESQRAAQPAARQRRELGGLGIE
jgi:recombination protein RecT